MIYSATIERDEGGSKQSPIKTALKVTNGLVYRVEVSFPPGSAGLMGVAIFDGSYQVWPSTIGEWFTGDGLNIGFEDVYLKPAAPFQFDIYAYNEDTKHPHTVVVRVGMVSKDIFMARFLPHLSYKFFEQMLDNLQQKQTEQSEEQRQQLLANPFPWLE